MKGYSLDGKYRLIRKLERPCDHINDARWAALALSMAVGDNDLAVGSLNLIAAALERALDGIEEVTDPIGEAWREANWPQSESAQ